MLQSQLRRARRMSSTIFVIGCVAPLTSVLAQERQEGQSAPRIEEVVVTATKRAESVQDTPASIAVIGADQLQAQGVTDIRLVNTLIPGVRFGKQQSTAQLFIRGVGIGSDNPNLDTAVAMVVNAVTQPREGTGASLFDLERVEVLKGPQGTIYGTNAIGGVINIVTARPKKDFSGDAFVEIGNYSRTQLNAAQNFPIGDKVQLRAAINKLDRDGYASTGLDDEDLLAERLSVAVQPTDRLNLLFWVQHYQADGLGDQGYATPPIDNSDPWQIGPINTASPRINEKRDISITQGGLELNWDLSDDLTLSWLPGYYTANRKDHLLIDTGLPTGSLFSTFTKRDQITQELRLANSDSGKWQWLAGLYYWRLDTEEQREFFTSGIQLKNWDIPQVLNESYAAFGQLTYSLTDATRLTAGARLARDKKSGHGNTFGPPPAYVVPPARVFTADYTWNHVDWKVGVEHDLNSTSMLYAAVQTGFLGGAFQNFPNGLNGLSNEVNPEKLLAFALGSKNSFAGGTFVFNGEAFYYDYKDYQTGLVSLAAGTNAFFNAPKAEVYGIDLEMQWAPTDADRLTLNAAAMHSEFTDFVVAQGVSSAVRAYDFNGYQLPNAPKLVATATYQHTFKFASGARVVPSITSQYSDGHWGNFSHGITRCSAVPPTVLTQDQCVDRALLQKSYTVTSVNLDFHSSSDRWRVGLFARNLENDNVLTSGGDAASPQARTATTWAPPRTYGAQFNVNW